MTLKMLEEGMNIDKLIFADTGMEFDEIYQTKERFESKTGLKVTTVRFKKPFEWYMLEKPVNKRSGTTQNGYGWCGKMRWGTALKRQLIAQELKGINITEYHGIACDEPNRLKKNAGRNIKYPLVNWKMTEKGCLNYCYSKGYNWGGLYEHLDRVSCWCCQNKNLKELKYIYQWHKDKWNELKRYEQQIGETMKDRPLDQLETRFKNEIYLENNQISLF